MRDKDADISRCRHTLLTVMREVAMHDGRDTVSALARRCRMHRRVLQRHLDELEGNGWVQRVTVPGWQFCYFNLTAQGECVRSKAAQYFFGDIIEVVPA